MALAIAPPLETQSDQLAREKRAVSYDSYDISVRQLVDMTENGEISISPAYQRHFIWDAKRESELVESIFLGIPVPSLYMATNSDATWEVVDGVQRLSTLLHFVGSRKGLENIRKAAPLQLSGLKKLSSFNEFSFEDLPKSSQLQFLTRPVRVTTLNDKSDGAVRYDLFERLNTGAVELHPQEIRNCVFRGPFMDLIKEKSSNPDYLKVTRLPSNEVQKATYEECVLRFYAFRDGYRNFGHDVRGFLNDYAITQTKRSAVVIKDPDDFDMTMAFLREELPNGITRGARTNVTPINLYEAVAVGTAIALRSGAVKRDVLKHIINDEALTKLTTGGTNSRPMVRGRIEYISTRLLS